MTIPAIPASDINRIRNIYENTTIESEHVSHIRMLLSHISDLTQQIDFCKELIGKTDLQRSDIEKYKPSDDALVTFEALMSLHKNMIRPDQYYSIDHSVLELVFEVIGSYEGSDSYFRNAWTSLNVDIDYNGDIVSWYFTPAGAMVDHSKVESYQGSFVHDCGIKDSRKLYGKNVWGNLIDTWGGRKELTVGEMVSSKYRLNQILKLFFTQ